MSDIFVSYSSRDRKTASALVTVLEQHHWGVWWDKNIAPGKAFDREISRALDGAKCILVLWSKSAVKSDWVMEEALEGAERKILVPARIDSVKLPFGFRRLQAIDLSGWRGSASSEGVENLVAAVEKLVKPGKKTRTQTEKATVAPRKARRLSGALDGKTIVFTGTLSESRAAHVEKVDAVGARYVDSVSGNTDYLVVGSKPGDTKIGAAKKHGVTQLSEQEWLDMLNEAYRRILMGKNIVFTGRLSEPRATLDDVARKLGAKPTAAVSSKTNYVIVGREASGKKLSDAKKYGATIIKEPLWLDIAATLLAPQRDRSWLSWIRGRA